MKIFTDGTKSDDFVGCAFVDTTNNTTRSYRLPPECSVYKAELYAILKATEYFLTYEGITNGFIICTDSLLSIAALKNTFSDNPIVKQIIKKIKQYSTAGYQDMLTYCATNVRMLQQNLV